VCCWRLFLRVASSCPYMDSVSPGCVLFIAHSYYVEVVVNVLSLLLGLVIVVPVIQGTLIPCLFPWLWECRLQLPFACFYIQLLEWTLAPWCCFICYFIFWWSGFVSAVIHCVLVEAVFGFCASSASL
jgi:hypothetical protein